jgi:hypothetical protein
VTVHSTMSPPPALAGHHCRREMCSVDPNAGFESALSCRLTFSRSTRGRGAASVEPGRSYGRRYFSRNFFRMNTICVIPKSWLSKYQLHRNASTGDQGGVLPPAPAAINLENGRRVGGREARADRRRILRTSPPDEWEGNFPTHKPLIRHKTGKESRSSSAQS